MSIIVPDMACLREPNLLVPKKKPVGNVKIDHSVLSKPVAWSIFPDTWTATSYFTNDVVRGTVAIGSMEQKIVSPIGRALHVPDIASGQSYYNEPGPYYADDFTLLTVARFTDLTNSKECYLSDSLSFRFYTRNTVYSMEWGIEYGLASIDSGIQLEPNKDYTLVIKRESGFFSFFYDDGESVNAGSHAASSRILSRLNISYAHDRSNYGAPGFYYYVQIMDGALTDAECRALVKNPFMSLVPA